MTQNYDDGRQRLSLQRRRAEKKAQAERDLLQAVKNMVHGWSWTDDDGHERFVKPWSMFSRELVEERLRALDSEEE